MKMKKIYLASGFFTEETRNKVVEVAFVLRKLGFSVFVPMEHEIPNAWEKPNRQWAKEVFENDIKAINECDEVHYLDFGYQGDCGAAWEVGYAYAKGIPVECYACGRDISLMIANSVRNAVFVEQK